MAEGVQIYECAPKTGGGHEWLFRAPEASLKSRAGEPLGKHYEGPTWASLDGNSVVAEVRARDPGPDPSAIPWLLLTAKANAGTGTGIFAMARSIQRVATVGGLAPSTPCTLEAVKSVARVPYAATYYFYR